ncbi:MAG: stage 0 sporulation family protein [Christensenellales bacterium]
MKNIVGVRFKKTGKVYFFDPGYIQLNLKDKVVVETSMGEDIGEVVINKRNIEEDKLTKPLKKVIRLANPKDLKRLAENVGKEKKAFKVCQQKIKEYNLNMNLVEVEFRFDNSKAIFYFTADGRIDFRELVKDLAAIYKTRIELRQIGVRDEVRKIGGNGMCGRELCCCSFLNDFDIVSIKMAKEQSASLNPSKISGNCGRLMCCLKYEQNVYEEKNSRLPREGAIVETADGKGVVCGVETLKEKIKVQFENEEGKSYKTYDAADIKILKNPKAKKSDANANKEDLENLKELEKLEKLEKEERKNVSKEDEY